MLQEECKMRVSRTFTVSFFLHVDFRKLRKICKGKAEEY